MGGDGTLYIADMLNDRIVARTTTGQFAGVGGSIDMPSDMATDARGRPYVADRIGRVFEITVNKSLNQVFDITSTRARVDQQSTSPLGISVTIAFSPANHLIAADEGRRIVYRIRGGEAERLLGGRGRGSSPDGVAAWDASVAAVSGVAVTRDNMLVVSEEGRLRAVRIV